MRALDRQKHFIEVPLVTRLRTAATELVSILLTKLAAPLANGLIGHDHSTLKQELFDITKAQAEAEVQPHGVADDLGRKAVILIFRGGGWYVHDATLTHCMGAQQVDNAPEQHLMGGRH